MKKNILIIFLIFSNISISQTLEQKMESIICECFEENITAFDDLIGFDIGGKCLKDSLKEVESKFGDEILSRIDSTSSNHYLEGIKLGEKIMLDMQESLVMNCDSYYSIIKDLNKTMFQNMAKEVNARKMDSLSELINERPKDERYLIMRGLYNLGFNKLKEAKRDFKHSLKINPENSIAYFQLGFTYDIQGKYKKAIKYYEKAKFPDKNLGGFEYLRLVFLGVAKRKKNENK